MVSMNLLTEIFGDFEDILFNYIGFQSNLSRSFSKFRFDYLNQSVLRVPPFTSFTVFEFNLRHLTFNSPRCFL